MNSAFQKLAEQEPGLTELEKAVVDHAAQHQRAERYCANRHWYAEFGFKAQMKRLAGFGARVPALRTMEAYDVAYRHLYSLLPDCRGCDFICL